MTAARPAKISEAQRQVLEALMDRRWRLACVNYRDEWIMVYLANTVINRHGCCSVPTFAALRRLGLIEEQSRRVDARGRATALFTISEAGKAALAAGAEQ